jgi:D-alanyl-D-alanine carboxypeptidase/D-alanyl-D-alanine-endopeptidase (penicillin-binding protein 4)
VPVDNPAVNAASRLAGLLRDRGVDVGSSDTGTAPAGGVEIAQVTSPTVQAIVGSMLSSSDNLSAELLTKEIGVKAAKTGTTAAGVAATTAELRKLGVPIADGALTDGSGLDRGNRVTCAILVAALGLAERPGLATLHDGLPVAAVNGTLYDQFVGTALAGNFRGKTGSLDGVSGLTGVFDLGRRIRFAFLDNGEFTEAQGAGIRVNIGNIIGRFPDAPPVDALVPAPQ